MSKENEKNNVVSNEAFDTDVTIKTPKHVKLKKGIVYGALTVGAIAIFLIGYAAISLVVQENNIKKQIKLEEQAEKNAEPIPDDLKDAAVHNDIDADYDDDELTVFNVKMNKPCKVEYEDAMTEGGVYCVGDNDTYEKYIGKDKMYVYSSYKIKSELYASSPYTVPNLRLISVNNVSSDDKKAIGYLYKHIKANETDSQGGKWVSYSDIAEDTFEVGDVIEVLAYYNKADDGIVDVTWHSPFFDVMYNITTSDKKASDSDADLSTDTTVSTEDGSDKVSD